MGREVSINSMVRLPRLNKDTLVALVWQLLTAAAAVTGEGLPLLIERARSRMAAAFELFKDATQPRQVVDTWVRVEAARELGAAWRAFYAWLEAMVAMPEEGAPPDLPALRTLHAVIFGDGLMFLKSAHREQWPQSQNRIEIIDENGTVEIIERCGGGAFIGPIREAHDRFGQLLGFTAPVQVEENSEIREHLHLLSAALRSYIGKVVAYADPEEPGSEALTEALLVPLVQWKDTPVHSNGDEEGEADVNDIEDNRSDLDLDSDTEEYTLPSLEAVPN